MRSTPHLLLLASAALVASVAAPPAGAQTYVTARDGARLAIYDSSAGPLSTVQMQRPGAAGKEGVPEWCRYVGTECQPLVLEQAYLMVYRGASTIDDEAYFAAQSELRVFGKYLWYGKTSLFRRSKGGVPVETLVAQFAARTDQDWFWSPAFCVSGGLLIPGTPLTLAPVDGYDRDAVNQVLAEENAGEIDRPWLGYAYFVKSGMRSGFEHLLAANRLHVRPEIRWAEASTTIIQSGGGRRLCPILGPVTTVPIPAAGGMGLTLLALALAVAGLVVSRRR